MKQWQEFLDSKFPDGFVVEWKIFAPVSEDAPYFGQPNPVAVAHRFYVIEDTPAPLVWFYVDQLHQDLLPFRITGWEQQPAAPGIYYALARTTDVTFGFSTPTPANINQLENITDIVPDFVT